METAKPMQVIGWRGVKEACEVASILTFAYRDLKNMDKDDLTVFETALLNRLSKYVIEL